MNRKQSKTELLIGLCGSIPGAVEFLACISNTMWNLEFNKDAPQARRSEPFRQRKKEFQSEKRFLSAIHLAIDEFQELFPSGKSNRDQIQKVVIEVSVEKGLVKTSARDIERRIHHRVYSASHFIETMLVSDANSSDLIYFLMRNIRVRHGCKLTPSLAGTFHAISSRLDQYIQEVASRRDAVHYLLDSYQELRRTLMEASGELESDGHHSIVDAYLEVARVVGFYRPNKVWPGQIQYLQSVNDAEYLISNLFGLRTSIPGFNQLFGGGGILFSESNTRQADCLPGRTTLIRGRFGSGKSLLALHLAVEVASKGGIAWYLALEQSSIECLYMLESLVGAGGNRRFRIAMNQFEVASQLRENTDACGGLLVLVGFSDRDDDSFREVLTDISNIGTRAGVRLVCADPINSLIQNTDPHQSTKLRLQTHNHLAEVTSSGTNVILVGEVGDNTKAELRFEENLADTVISLNSVASEHGYSQRYFEITKSRLQREQRGRHPMSIQPGKGIVIFPASAAILVRDRSRRLGTPWVEGPFGLPSLDRLFGDEPLIRSGDLIAMQGAVGTYKTRFGLLFLRELMQREIGVNKAQSARNRIKSSESRKRVSLFVTMRYSQDYVDHILKEPAMVATEKKSRDQNCGKNIRVCLIPGGFVQPGAIFQRIGKELDRARTDEYIIDRVLLDNVTEWNDACPFVKDDETFLETLIRFFRCRNIATIATCGISPDDDDSREYRQLLDSADTLIQLDSFEYRSNHRVLFRIQQSPHMNHPRDAFEVKVSSDSGYELTRSASLLRFVQGQDVSPVGIHLFLQTESDLQAFYNRSVSESIKSVLSPDVVLSSPESIRLTDTFTLGDYSAIDELQVVQLDEFQLGIDGSHCPLYLATEPDLIKRYMGSRDRFKDHIFQNRNELQAFPYYDNLSFLAMNEDCFGPEHLADWHSIADRVSELENHEQYKHRIVFDFPKGSSENYNCLYLEILQSLLGRRLSSRDGSCNFVKLLQSKDAVKAANLLRRLCYRAHQGISARELPANHKDAQGNRSTFSKIIDFEVDTNAVIWRHWFTTFSEMMKRLPQADAKKVVVNPLPGNVSTAGEWYLGIPTHSAAPDVAIKIVEMLSSKKAELRRFYLGVGLPTSKELYISHENPHTNNFSGENPPSTAKLSQVANLSFFEKLADKPFQRSSFGCYSNYSQVLADHLKLIIELERSKDSDEQIRAILDRAIVLANFVNSSNTCSRCTSTNITSQ